MSQRGIVISRLEGYDKNAVLYIAAPGNAKADLMIIVNGKSYDYEVYPKPTEKVFPLHMKHGNNIVRLSTNTAKVQAPNDSRSLYMCLVKPGIDALCPKSPRGMMK